MVRKDPRVDAYIARSAPFARPILRHLRKVIHAGCPGVVETIKWGMPAFEHVGPLAGIAAFKAHGTLGFWKHSLLVKEGPLLPRPVETAMGQFGPLASLDDLPAERVLLTLVRRAAKLNAEGIKVARPAKPKPALEAPPYFMAALRGNSKALSTYQGFSPSQRREYVEWVSEAKTGETRRRRIETALQWMAEGKIRNWKYVRTRRETRR